MKPRSSAAARKDERELDMGGVISTGAKASQTRRPLSRAIGLMNGTSLDGIAVPFIEGDGESGVATGPWLTLPYEPALREALRATLGGKGPTAEVERRLTEAHAAAVARLIERHN